MRTVLDDEPTRELMRLAARFAARQTRRERIVDAAFAAWRELAEAERLDWERECTDALLYTEAEWRGMWHGMVAYAEALADEVLASDGIHRD
jgi:hypothetical protein